MKNTVHEMYYFLCCDVTKKSRNNIIFCHGTRLIIGSILYGAILLLMNMAPPSLSLLIFFFLFFFTICSVSLCVQSIWDKNPNDELQLSGTNWLPCCTTGYVKVHLYQCMEMFVHVCFGVYEHMCAHVPHGECVLCDPGNADQRVKRRTS